MYLRRRSRRAPPARRVRVSKPTLETLIEQGDVSGVLLLSDELRETITPRELDLVRQAFEAGLRRRRL
jgi:hypothetical protein